MSRAATMGVQKQLALAFGVLAAIVLLVAVVAVRALGTTNDSFTHYKERVAAQSQLANRLADAVNDRAVAARNLVLVSSPADVAQEKAAVTRAHENTQALLQQLRQAAALQGSSAHTAMVARIAEIEGRYGPVALDIVAKALNGEREAAVEKMNNECRPLLAALLGALGQYVDSNTQEGNASVLAAAERYDSARVQLWGACAVAVAAALLLGGLITRSLRGALGGEPQVAARVARAVAEGDLSTEIRVHPGDSASLMAQLHTMQESLVRVVADVRQNAQGVASASAEIESGNSDLSNRTESQASALEETAASMEQLGATVRQNADNALSANQLAMAASTVAEQGGAVVGQVVDTMKGIHSSSQRIADIIGVIDSIAFQTNILALNAAVEAARAGEQGRGFAVVASEVRSLAGRSAEAAKEIKQLISASVDQVAQGTQLVDQAGSTMQEVVRSIRRVTDIMGEISAASREQSAGVAQVGEAITQMDQTTQQNAALVEQSAAGARALRERAGELVRAVAVFRLPAGQGERTAPAQPALRAPVWAGNASRPVVAGVRPAARIATFTAQAASLVPVPGTALGHSPNVPLVPAVRTARAQPAEAAHEEWEAF